MKKKKKIYSNDKKRITLLTLLSFVSFYLGTQWPNLWYKKDFKCAIHHDNSSNNNVKASSSQLAFQQYKRDVSSEFEMELKIARLELEVLELKERAELEFQFMNSAKVFPYSTSSYMSGIARMGKLEFFNKIDTGVSMDPIDNGRSEVVILYDVEKSFPSSSSSETSMKIPVDVIDQRQSSSIINIDNADKVFENCDYVNVVLNSPDPGRGQCVAIVPHSTNAPFLYKFHKINRNTNTYKMEGRGLTQRKDEFIVPRHFRKLANYEQIKKYLSSLDNSLNDLHTIISDMKKKSKKMQLQHSNNVDGGSSNPAVIVMIVNFGQSELVLNFICSARSRNFDISNVLIFATDLETKNLLDGFGVATYYDEALFGNLPTKEAGVYGDAKFTAMMFAKVSCVFLVNALGYDVLFQDADIIWYKDPLLWFHNEYENFDEYDMLYQDDGARSLRFGPLSANTGFYYVKANVVNAHFMSTLLLSCDLVQTYNSHQQALIVLINNFSSLYGMRVKVFSRDEEEFPGGYQYHKKSGKYVRAYFKGEKHPIIFHMSWTHNKANKVLFFQQLGEWYLQDQCIQHKVEDITKSIQPSPSSSEEVKSHCCAIKPIIKCHYKDKPSVIPCRDSPSIDKGGKSWWK